MEEGRNKFRFVIWLLVVIIIIFATLLSVSLVKTVNENGTKIIEDTNNSNQEQIKEGGNINNEVVDNVENVIENNDTTNTTEQENNVTETARELTEERVLQLAKMVLENSRGSSESVVKVMYGIEIANNGKQYTDTATGSLYNLTDLGYNKFKAQVLRNFSEKYFEELNNFKGRKIVIEKDGYLAILEGTWSGAIHQVKSAKLNKIENETYYYTVNTTKQQGEVSVDVMYDIHIKLIDGNYVIDSMIIKYVN